MLEEILKDETSTTYFLENHFNEKLEVVVYEQRYVYDTIVRYSVLKIGTRNLVYCMAKLYVAALSDNETSLILAKELPLGKIFHNPFKKNIKIQNSIATRTYTYCNNGKVIGEIVEAFNF